MWTNKSIMLFVLSLIAVVLLSLNMANAEEKKITPKNFVTTISEVPSKIGNHITKEISKTKEYQKKSWENSKIQFAKTKYHKPKKEKKLPQRK